MSDKGVVFLPSFYDAMKDLPDSDRLQLYDAIVNYGLFRTPIELSPICSSLFSLIRPIIDSSQRRYDAAVENGKKPPKPGKAPRGRPRKNHDEDISAEDLDELRCMLAETAQTISEILQDNEEQEL